MSDLRENAVSRCGHQKTTAAEDPMPPNPAPAFSTDIELRFSDLDAYGHVNNAVFFTYLETARTKLFLDKFIDFMNGGLLFLVVRAECEYRKPIRLSDHVVVSMTVSRIGRSSFDIDYAVHNGSGVTFAAAKTAMVCYDDKSGKAVAIPEDFKTHFS
jgi:acyl-CoA thioester hydrolase